MEVGSVAYSELLEGGNTLQSFLQLFLLFPSLHFQLSTNIDHCTTILKLIICINRLDRKSQLPLFRSLPFFLPFFSLGYDGQHVLSFSEEGRVCYP